MNHNEFNEHNLSKKSFNLLTRVDWRFLTSNPNPGKSICFVDGLLQQAVELISKSIVKRGSNYKNGDCDLAVSVNPDINESKQACLALKPNGCYYVEWDCNLLFNPRSIHNILSCAGFEDIKLYLPKPSPIEAPPGIWVPLDKPSAINYLMKASYEYKAKSFIKQSLYNIRYLLWLLIPSLFISTPGLLNSKLNRFILSSIAYKPKDRSSTKLLDNNKQSMLQSSTPNPSSLSIILNRIGRINQTLLPKFNVTTDSSLMLTKSGSYISKIMFLLIDEKQNEPCLVVKIPRTKESALNLTNGVNTLKNLENRKERITGIPKVVFNDIDSEFGITAETYLRGLQMSKIINKGNCRDLALKVTSWLVEFARITKTHLYDNWRKDLLETVMNDFTTSFENVVESELLQQSKEELLQLEIPFLICDHLDFSLGNISTDSEGQIGVFDWECSRLRGLPGVDLIYFLIDLSIIMEDAFSTLKFRECYRNMLNPETFTGKIFNECFNYYVDQVGIARSSFHPLCLYILLMYSCPYDKFETKVQVNHDDSDVFSKNIYLTMWEEEILSFKVWGEGQHRNI